MTYKKHIQKAIESSAKAPSELRQKTLKKIEKLDILFEMMSFYVAIPTTLLDAENEKNVNQ